MLVERRARTTSGAGGIHGSSQGYCEPQPAAADVGGTHHRSRSHSRQSAAQTRLSIVWPGIDGREARADHHDPIEPQTAAVMSSTWTRKPSDRRNVARAAALKTEAVGQPGESSDCALQTNTLRV